MSDINQAMLSQGRERLVDAGAVGNLDYLLINAEQIPFADDSFDCVTIGFGLRNVTHKQFALNEMFRVLRPGGRALVLEFSHPTTKPLAKAYDLYSFSILPTLGRLVAGDAESYRYLAESIRMHPDQETLRAMMEQAGLERCDFFNLTGGIVAIHRGYKL
jgi:demethylmenaquinone methyltransferase/2-methoxy-6-polyprenyl-1,4-benzoquinol methylase